MKFQVKDCMSKKIKSISPDASAQDALKTLIDTGTSGLLVIGKEGSLEGVFTEKEILKTIMPAYVKEVGAFVYGADSKSELKKIADLEKYRVKDIMRREVPVVDEDTSLTEASRIMLTQSERRLAVVRDKKVVGVVTRHDLVRALASAAGIKV